jgi:type II secretory ATPase GspE/PulE/Tfp pilus assembly ATPase PilB-like protein/DNA-binding NarL/FixJ family response regulator
MSNLASLFTGLQGGSVAAKAPSPRYRLLLVDDEPNVLRALQRVFHQENYEIITASNGIDGLRALEPSGAQVVISDYMMPEMNGADFLRQVKQQHPETIRIMLTGHADSGAVMGAIKEGAVYKFILKPWNDDDLRLGVSLAIEQYELARKNRALNRENQNKAKELSALARLAVNNRSQLAILLSKKDLLNAQQTQELHRLQQQRKEPMIKLIVERGWVDEKIIHNLLCTDMLLEEVALEEFVVDPAVAALVPHAFCSREWVVPLRLTGRKLLLAMADPLDTGLLSDVRFVTGLDVVPALAKIQSVKAKIAEIYGATDCTDIRELESIIDVADPYEGVEIVIEDADDVTLEELLRQTEEPPSIRLANSIVLEAIRLRASDIHIQPRTKNVAVRLRIDGVLIDKFQIPSALHQSLVSRIKVMAELDISERRRPQDGRITVKTPTRVVDLRISTLPTINGEKVVMRILDRNSSALSLERLGFLEGDLKRIARMAEKPQGIILATGPTGSGKTTTLYSLLQHSASPGKNYITLEDPVEYFMDQAGQVLIRERIGLTFPVALRAILRQDPDVILLGEIRDVETAEVAFHAASTGHVVFSTLHTNSAAATVSRLFDLGLKREMVATTLEGIIAQRLVRKVCDRCGEEHTPDRNLLAQLGPRFLAEIATGRRGRGCSQCHGTGYEGRVGIYEVLAPDDILRQQIAAGASVLEIARSARERGFAGLLDDALEKTRLGLTTAEEIYRVFGPQG